MMMTLRDNLDVMDLASWVCVCWFVLVGRLAECALETVVFHAIVEGVCVGFNSFFRKLASQFASY